MKSFVNSSEFTYRTRKLGKKMLGIVPNRVQEVGFTQPRIAINKEGGYRLGRGDSETANAAACAKRLD